MSAIASINAAVSGVFAATVTTLSADDTITFKPTKKQLLLLTNTTAGALTATLDGDGGTTIAVPGVGSVSVAGGLAIPLAAGESKGVFLGSVRGYCKGVVHLLGGTGIKAQLFDL
jgi:hypothetical protein